MNATPTITPEILSSAAGILLSILASYLPGFSAWFDALLPTYKRLLMLGLLLAASLAAFGVSCSGLENTITCTGVGAWELFKIFVMALISNQAAFLISP
jgi:hypothetical protein